jgi:nicotinamidase/pyrazinamidase
MADPRAPYEPSTALVVVDVQNDFAHPDGSLHVDGGDAVIGPINGQIAAARSAGATVVLSQDWHPEQTSHFVTGGGTWPVHCVRGTWGAELHAELSRDADLIIRKGTGGEDGYSAFGVEDPETGTTSPTGLTAYLRERGIDEVVVCGLAADVCVRATALDALREGFATTVLWEATRAVDVGDGERAAEELAAAGISVVGRCT